MMTTVNRVLASAASARQTARAMALLRQHLARVAAGQPNPCPLMQNGVEWFCRGRAGSERMERFSGQRAESGPSGVGSSITDLLSQC
jgi:hypothetical protein